MKKQFAKKFFVENFFGCKIVSSKTCFNVNSLANIFGQEFFGCIIISSKTGLQEKKI